MKFVFPDIFTSAVPDNYNNGSLRESSVKVTDYAVRATLEFNKNIQKHFVQALIAEELGGNKNS